MIAFNERFIHLQSFRTCFFDQQLVPVLVSYIHLSGTYSAYQYTQPLHAPERMLLAQPSYFEDSYLEIHFTVKRDEDSWKGLKTTWHY